MAENTINTVLVLVVLVIVMGIMGFIVWWALFRPRPADEVTTTVTHSPNPLPAVETTEMLIVRYDASQLATLSDTQNRVVTQGELEPVNRWRPDMVNENWKDMDAVLYALHDGAKTMRHNGLPGVFVGDNDNLFHGIAAVPVVGRAVAVAFQLLPGPKPRGTAGTVFCRRQGDAGSNGCMTLQTHCQAENTPDLGVWCYTKDKWGPATYIESALGTDRVCFAIGIRRSGARVPPTVLQYYPNSTGNIVLQWYNGTLTRTLTFPLDGPLRNNTETSVPVTLGGYFMRPSDRKGRYCANDLVLHEVRIYRNTLDAEDMRQVYFGMHSRWSRWR